METIFCGLAVVRVHGVVLKSDNQIIVHTGSENFLSIATKRVIKVCLCRAVVCLDLASGRIHGVLNCR
jgi:hypothetical protein